MEGSLCKYIVQPGQECFLCIGWSSFIRLKDWRLTLEYVMKGIRNATPCRIERSGYLHVPPFSELLGVAYDC